MSTRARVIEEPVPAQPAGNAFILTLTCADRPGIVAAVAGVFAAAGYNIDESSQFGDRAAGRFFMRVRFSTPASTQQPEVEGLLRPVADRFGMAWGVRTDGQPTRTVILVSKFDHCLIDLIYRRQIGALNIAITRVVSNHEAVRALVEHAGLAFTYLPVTAATKSEQEHVLAGMISEDRSELIVLARYMQVLSDRFATDHYGRVINIHHSFLPSFKGAHPYKQAHARGVKLIGATAHYVTAELDEGPIIEQETERVDHAMGVADLIAAGQDIERRVLARAIKYHCERRVLLNGSKTVVFK